MNHGVDAAAGDLARTVLGDDDLPAVGLECRERDVDGDLNLTSRARRFPGHRVDGLVADQEQGPAGRDARRQLSHHRRNRSGHVDYKQATRS